MEQKPPANRSIASQFTRHYLFISIVPSLILLTLMAIGAGLTWHYMSDLIVKSTYDLNEDAEQGLRHLGEQIIQAKSRDVARQIEMYFRMHPKVDIRDMRKDPLFMELALQRVGQTGYTAMTEARKPGDLPTEGLEPVIFRVHENPKLHDRDMSFLGEKMTAWWAICKKGLDGVEADGYYEWCEPDGTCRPKYLYVTPVQFPLNGITMMVSAVTYIDEFSKPIVAMRRKADRVAQNYQRYVSSMMIVFGVVCALVLVFTFLLTFVLARRAGLRFIVPVAKLAQAAQHLGEGNWEAQVPDHVLGREDEIGVMARSFQSMSGQLKETFGRLEQRVVELRQTRDALKDSEDHYRTLYEESRRAEEVYRSLISSSADAIVIMDLQESVTYVSPTFERIFGWRLGELAGRTIPLATPPTQSSEAGAIREVIENGVTYHGYETTLMTKDGRAIDVSLSASRYNDHEGRPAGALIILRDISEAKRLKEHLQQVDRLEAIATLAGGVAHDFNNLLMVIQGTVSILMDAIPESDRNYKYLINIEKQVNRGARLTRQLLGYARKGKYDVRPMQLNDVITDSAETLRRTRKDIRIHYALAKDLRTIEGDAYQMEQVLMNLFINASDAMPAGGDLTLLTKNIKASDIPDKLRKDKTGNYVLLVVEDTGVGMDRKVMDRIFEPFFTTKAVNKGTGLGLASVYGILQSHGGAIDVSSEAGTGTRFSIYLPASDKPAAETIEKSKKTYLGKGTILLIDDEQPVLDVAEEVIQSIGFETLAAGDGLSGIEIYRHNRSRIDLVILDMVMPDLGGAEVFDRLREIDPGVTVLLASGYSIDGRASEILSRGCNGFIQKPFSREDLAEKIESILKPI